MEKQAKQLTQKNQEFDNLIQKYIASQEQNLNQTQTNYQQPEKNCKSKNRNTHNRFKW